jgi:hypothetical protein
MLQPLHGGARTETNKFGGLEHACALGERTSSGFKLPRVGVGASEATHAFLAGLADEMTIASDGIFSTGQPRTDARDDHLAFELAEDAEHAKHGPASGRAGVDCLRVDVEPGTHVARLDSDRTRADAIGSTLS